MSCACARELPTGYGDGWMSRNARDLVRILVVLGGVCPKALNIAIMRRSGNSSRMVNTATVENAMDDLNQLCKEVTP